MEEKDNADPEGLDDPDEGSGGSCLAIGVILAAVFMAVTAFPLWSLMGMAVRSGGWFENLYMPVLFVSPLILLAAVLLAAAFLWTKNRVLLGLAVALLLIAGVAFAPLLAALLAA